MIPGLAAAAGFRMWMRAPATSGARSSSTASTRHRPGSADPNLADLILRDACCRLRVDMLLRMRSEFVSSAAVVNSGEDHLVAVGAILGAERNDEQLERAERRVVQRISGLRYDGPPRRAELERESTAI